MKSDLSQIFMKKINELWDKYHVDRLLGIFWVLAFGLEFFFMKCLSFETRWLPFIGLVFCIVFVLRAGFIQARENNLPLCMIVACIPGLPITALWFRHFVTQTIEAEKATSAASMFSFVSDVALFSSVLASSIYFACLGVRILLGKEE